MGLIRKSLAVSTLGLVRGSSKKQRVAKKTLKSSLRQEEIMEAQLRASRVATVEEVAREAVAAGVPRKQVERGLDLYARGGITLAEYHETLRELVRKAVTKAS